LAKILKAPLKNGIEAEILLRERYDTWHGIYDFDHAARDPSKSNRPFALVALHDKEDYLKQSALYRLMHRFVLYKVKDRTGMSWMEFINQPSDIVRHWFSICQAEQQREVNDPQLKKEMKNMEALERMMHQTH